MYQTIEYYNYNLFMIRKKTLIKVHISENENGHQIVKPVFGAIVED